MIWEKLFRFEEVESIRCPLDQIFFSHTTFVEIQADSTAAPREPNREGSHRLSPGIPEPRRLPCWPGSYSRSGSPPGTLTTITPSPVALQQSLEQTSQMARIPADGNISDEIKKIREIVHSISSTNIDDK
ncbi:hypothetical protein AVEN_265057-1 [Araneus ventricosus]|uniref:Uncharacterized protein n=1 Tax=Araneus ventricosus TaxID=182803 RepID=A0A4Y2R3Y9_ARAVE|nr:hypothetical protein AVEN_265057-1 [Araneus ventricosus]